MLGTTLPTPFYVVYQAKWRFSAGTVTVIFAVYAAAVLVSRLAPPERRGQVISAFFAACYAGLIIPVVGVGVLSGFIGTYPAVLAFSLLLAALCLLSLARIATALGPDRTASR